MANKKWNQLSPRTRQLVLIGGAIEGALKIIALLDLARRPTTEVRGNKRTWAATITLVNAFGAVPLAYLLRGRRSSTDT